MTPVVSTEVESILFFLREERAQEEHYRQAGMSPDVVAHDVFATLLNRNRDQALVDLATELGSGKPDFSLVSAVIGVNYLHHAVNQVIFTSFTSESWEGMKKLAASLADDGKPLPGYTVELWHDTEDWNEGFELASTPFLYVTVPTHDEAEALAEKVTDESGGWSRGEYTSFTGRTAPGYGPVLPAADAERIVVAAASTFEGP